MKKGSRGDSEKNMLREGFMRNPHVCRSGKALRKLVPR